MNHEAEVIAFNVWSFITLTEWNTNNHTFISEIILNVLLIGLKTKHSFVSTDDYMLQIDDWNDLMKAIKKIISN